MMSEDLIPCESTEVCPCFVSVEPGGGEEVELEMLVSVSQVSVAQRDTVVRQLAALLHVLDSDIQVRALQGRSHLRYRRDNPDLYTCTLILICWPVLFGLPADSKFSATQESSCQQVTNVFYSQNG